MGDHRRREAPEVPSLPWPIVVGGLAAFLSLLGTAVALALAGWSTEAIVGLLSGLGGVCVILLTAAGKLLAEHGRLREKTAELQEQTTEQTTLLAKIDDQTNGSLDARIRRAVRQVLDERLSMMERPPSNGDHGSRAA